MLGGKKMKKIDFLFILYNIYFHLPEKFQKWVFIVNILEEHYK